MNICFPAFITLPWRADAAEFWFSRISYLPWAILLHSGYSNHPSSRFDIMVAHPLVTLTTSGNLTLIRNTKTSNMRCSLRDPLTLLEEALCDSGLTMSQSHPDLPFLGGALGLFGYDLGRRFEKIPLISKADINLPDMAVGLYDWALIVDHQRKTITLLSHSDLLARLDWLERLQYLSVATNNFCLTSPWLLNMHEKEYLEKFQRVLTYLRSGDCYQVNLALRFQATYHGSEWQAFCCLNASNRAPFSAFLRLEKGAILSLSPERFICLANGTILSRPIKGTLPRLTDAYADQKQSERLLASSKDRAENLMIVDLMRNDIGRVAIPGSVRVPELFMVELFPAVYHLVSTITANLLPSCSACDLLRAVFPGGSVTGAPKIRAMEIIDELEPQRRNVWCGSIGYLSFCGKMDSSIAIRTLIAWDGQIYCSAGSGIVDDSKALDEYQEIFDKIRFILKQLEG